jgi:MYXO-CTERM domain-containing protein
VAVYTATLVDGTPETQYFLRQGESEQRLYFDEDPALLPGTRLAVWGEDREGGGLQVSRFRTDAATTGVGTTSEALIGATPYKPRTFAFVRVDIGSGINLTVDDAKKRLFGTDAGNASVKQYYNEVSYGTQDIGGDILGPFTYRMVGCDTRGLASTLKAQVGVYDHYLWYMGSQTSACAWSGLAESGLPEKPTNDTWFNGSAGCVVLVQEPGHNFGMMHSSSMGCGGQPFADNPDATCTHNEYGDRYDPMGGGCNHMNAWQKVYEGWLQKCNAVKVSGSGTFTLHPLEVACDGIQVLQIPMPKVRPFSRAGGGGTATTENLAYYYLELRTARGFDASIRVAPTILVHVAEDFKKRTDRGRHTWILDMQPASTRTIEGLGAGESYTDPAGGVSFQVVSISADQAEIKVTAPGTAGGTCLDASAYNASTATTCTGIVSTDTGGTSGTGGASGTGGTAGAGGTGTTGGAGGAANPGVPRVDAFTLIDTTADSDVIILEDGMTLDLDQLPTGLTLRADTDPPTVGSVTFTVDTALVRTESTVPYSLSSDNGAGDYTPWDLQLGTHTITATPYTAANAQGTVGEPLTMTITLARGVLGTGGAGGIVASGGAPGAGGGPQATGGFGNPASGGFPAATGGAPVASGGAFGSGGIVGFPGTGGVQGSSKDDSGCSCSVPGKEHPSRGYAHALGVGIAVAALRRARRRRFTPRHTR